MYSEDKITDELLARFIEGNVSDEERSAVLLYLQTHQNDLSAIIIAAQEVAFQQQEAEKSKGIYQRYILDKRSLSDDDRYQLADKGKISMAADDNDFSCAIKAQQLVLSDYGIFVSLDELTRIAKENGWFIEHSGSPLDYVGELLNYFNVSAVQMRNANIYHLINELSQGHKIIVGIDINDLLQTERWQQFDDVLVGKEANHVLVVAGIQTSEGGEPQIVLTDPTRPESKKVFTTRQFMGAWEDSGYFMVATTQPAPIQYNPEMAHFDYVSGHVNQFADIAYGEILKRLENDGYLAKNKSSKSLQKVMLLCSLTIVFLLIVFGCVWNFLTPFPMKISFSEDTHYTIEALPFSQGTVTLSYGEQQPQTHTITNNNLNVVLHDISPRYKGKEIRIQFAASGYLSIDTTLPIQRQHKLFIRRDNSLGRIFGTVLSATDGQPVMGVQIRVLDRTTITDNIGGFSIEIPYNQQNSTQTLTAYKDGYEIWRGTYEPSQVNPWEIVLRKL